MTSSHSIIPFGLCQCGCGLKTSLSPKTYTRDGIRKGEPNKFISGHRSRIPNTSPRKRKLQLPIDAEPFKLRGEYCRVIPLTNGGVCIVSACDYDDLMRWNWHSLRDSSGALYVCRAGLKSEGLAETSVRMHRYILGLKRGDPRVGDHIDPWNTLDNSRSNLRIATLSQNARNCRRQPENAAGFKGVYFDAGKNSYRVRVCFGGRKFSFGYRKTAEEASEVYCRELARLESTITETPMTSNGYIDFRKKVVLQIHNQFNPKDDIAEIVKFVLEQKIPGQILVSIPGNGGITAITFQEKQRLSDAVVADPIKKTP